MSIKSVYFLNFTVFEDLKMDFSNGINVVIGANGTGKTQLLKAMYGINVETNEKNKGPCSIASSYFSVSPKQLKRNPGEQVKVEITFADNTRAAYKIQNESEICEARLKVNSIFIPAKEMLSQSKELLALYNKCKIPFDKTYIDIIEKAALPGDYENSELNEALLENISKVMGGTVLHERGTFYIVKTSGSKIEFSIESDGLCKFGLLWKLIKNRLLEEGTVLYWDEPEVNISPELIPILVDLILGLERKGVQLFITTRSYNLAKYLEIKRTTIEQVLFHRLHQTEHSTKADSDYYFGQLDYNPIIEADSKLLDEVIDKNY